MPRSCRSSDNNGVRASKSTPLPKSSMANVQSGPAVRTIIYAEVGDMSAEDIQKAMNTLSKSAMPHQYFIPVRHGKVTADICFEKEILATVNKLCEVVNGEIVLRGNVEEVEIIRQFTEEMEPTEEAKLTKKAEPTKEANKEIKPVEKVAPVEEVKPTEKTEKKTEEAKPAEKPKNKK